LGGGCLRLFFNLLYFVRAKNEGETRCGRSPLKKDCLLLAPSIRSLFVMVAFLFLETVFGGLRFLSERRFLLDSGLRKDSYHR